MIMQEAKLKPLFTPSGLVYSFLPLKNKCHDTLNIFTMGNLIYWTNKRARMKKPDLGVKFDEFQEFILKELMQHI